MLRPCRFRDENNPTPVRIALINTNRIRPPIAPLGLEYCAAAAAAAGHEVRTLDLCWEEDMTGAIRRFFGSIDYDLVGLTLRNSDDSAFPTRRSFLPDFRKTTAEIRENTDAPIILGGVGFSIMPEEILGCSPVDGGVWGDGEGALVALARALKDGDDWRLTPGVVCRDGAGFRRNPPAFPPLDSLPRGPRVFFDHPRYFREGGQAGFETKRGCPARCIFCADPLAKGRSVRLRSPASVTDEIQGLLSIGIDHLHTCDSEFNLPGEHAREVCRGIIRRGLGEKVRWYAYGSPSPFPRELARLMRRAGCAGIDFGADSADDRMLKLLGRDFAAEDVLTAARIAKEEGMAVMLDLLLGAPGETRESLKRTIGAMKESPADRVGVSLGVRVYPGTELSRRLEGRREGLIGGRDLDDPLYYLDPAVAPFAAELVDSLIGDDRKFFFFDPSRPERNYNYDANQLLEGAIRKGYRGAYWDILRRLSPA